jgi:hypothetical protein
MASLLVTTDAMVGDKPEKADSLSVHAGPQRSIERGGPCSLSRLWDGSPSLRRLHGGEVFTSPFPNARSRSPRRRKRGTDVREALAGLG